MSAAFSSDDTPSPVSRPPRESSLGRGIEETLALEGQLVDILDGYLADLKSGQAPNRDELIARHPQLASQLEACLAGLEFIHRAESTEMEAPPRLGDFRLLREVGRGGIGAVYEAQQISLGRRVAVKVLRFGSVADIEAIDRFRREAETVAHLHHTNIVPIYFVGRDDGVNYYAMQFIDGQSLADVLSDQTTAIDPLTAIEWGLQAAEALAHAHQRGVIHRDVKPSNLLLDADQRIWLTDFGLAKRLDDVTLSMTGALLGTPRYMSPEQASAARHQLDHRTDIYSLGATLYELITGQPVFSADKPYQIIGQILSQDPVPPRKWVPTLPRDVETILLKCLAKDPSQRYASANLGRRSRAVLDSRPIKARCAGLTERGLKWVRRHQRSLKLTAATVAVTITAVVLSLLAVNSYNRRQLSYLTLASDQPPLSADLRDTAGRLVARQTVPTQEPLPIPGGNYRLQISGEGRLSETYGVHLRRGESPKLEFNLDASLLMAPLQIEQSYRLVQVPGGAFGVVMDETGLRCWDLKRNSLRWNMSLSGEEQPLLRESAGWVWPWNRLLSGSSYHNWGPYDVRPYVVSPAADLDGDAVADLVLAARHQACLCAVSGADGKLLWLTCRGHDLDQPIPDPQARFQQGVVSAIVSEPTTIEDVDGDGIPEYVVTWADEVARPNPVVRRLELISGATGKSLWLRELEDRWFTSDVPGPIPEAYRWFTGSGAASSWIGGNEDTYGSPIVHRDRGRIERTGYYHRIMSRPLVISQQNGSAVTRQLGILSASHLLLFDPQTGASVGDPLECGMQPGLPPIVADVDGDSSDEIVLLQELTTGVSGAGRPARARVGVLSVTQRKLLWTAIWMLTGPPSNDRTCRCPVGRWWPIWNMMVAVKSSSPMVAPRRRFRLVRPGANWKWSTATPDKLVGNAN